MNEPITYERLQEALEKACDKLEDLDYELNMTEGCYRNNKDADE